MKFDVPEEENKHISDFEKHCFDAVAKAIYKKIILRALGRLNLLDTRLSLF